VARGKIPGSVKAVTLNNTSIRRKMGTPNAGTTGLTLFDRYTLSKLKNSPPKIETIKNLIIKI
jgi:hypothetical protein